MLGRIDFRSDNGKNDILNELASIIRIKQINYSVCVSNRTNLKEINNKYEKYCNIFLIETMKFLLFVSPKIRYFPPDVRRMGYDASVM